MRVNGGSGLAVSFLAVTMVLVFLVGRGSPLRSSVSGTPRKIWLSRAAQRAGPCGGRVMSSSPARVSSMPSLRGPDGGSRRSTRCCVERVGDAELSLEALTDTAKDAAFLEASIQTSLDKEWIKQDIHGVIGSEVGRLYTKFRGDGVDDVTLMVLEIGGFLSDPKLFDMGDAFVGGWDVANMVGDLLIARIAGPDGADCACSDVVAIPAEE
uniref:Uncharacterized protein n=1 Tax=Lotharella globosa TaxID=91324 RepID=A0A7S4DMC2_9EUKA